MKKIKTKLAKCPCCLIERHRTEIQTCISILEKLEKQKYKHYKELWLEQYTYTSLIDSNFEWACDMCLEKEKAILSTPGLQETTSTPHLAYFDTQLKCYTCKTAFLFTKEEKKVWFESYKLQIHAKPNSCLDCRRKNQKLNGQNKIMSETLKKSEPELTNSELEQIIEIYTSWDKTERVKYYQSILSKRLRKN